MAGPKPEEQAPFTEREFVKNPTRAYRQAERGPVTIVNDEGEPSFILSVPRDVRPLPLD